MSKPIEIAVNPQAFWDSWLKRRQVVLPAEHRDSFEDMLIKSFNSMYTKRTFYISYDCPTPFGVLIDGEWKHTRYEPGEFDQMGVMLLWKPQVTEME